MAMVSSKELSYGLAGGADTIVACATGAAPSALAILRISGSDCASVCRKVLGGANLKDPWKARLTRVLGRDGERIDDAIAIPYKGPKSYTGEDLVEIIVHGSPWVVEETIASCVDAGARVADPGEFTRRALANGKIDLIQAEAVQQLIQAETGLQAKMALEQQRGGLSRAIQKLRERLTALAADLEAAVEFGDMGIELSEGAYLDAMEEVRGGLRRLVQTFSRGERLRAGFRVVISGPTNAGKSTLFNRMLGRDRAIVSEVPGTTRDVLEGSLEIAGVPVVLVDTAGIRGTGDPVESAGVERARNAAESADLVLDLRSVEASHESVFQNAGEKKPSIQIVTKVDLEAGRPTPESADEIRISCVTGEGLQELLDRVTKRLRKLLGPDVPEEGLLAVNERHRACLQNALDKLDRCDPVDLEIRSELVSGALRDLAVVVGEVDVEDVLDAVFSSFCLGK